MPTWNMYQRLDICRMSSLLWLCFLNSCGIDWSSNDSIRGCLVWHAQANTLCQNCDTILVTCGRSPEREVLSWHWILHRTGCMVTCAVGISESMTNVFGLWLCGSLWNVPSGSLGYSASTVSFYFCCSGTGVPLQGSRLECLSYLHTKVEVKCLWFESLWVCLGLSKWAHGWSQSARMKWAVASVQRTACLTNGLPNIMVDSHEACFLILTSWCPFFHAWPF